MDELVKKAIHQSVRVSIETGAFIKQVREGVIPLTKERLMEELQRITRTKELIRECEKEGVALPLERRDLDEIEKMMWALTLEKL